MIGVDVESGRGSGTEVLPSELDEADTRHGVCTSPVPIVIFLKLMIETESLE